MKSVDTGTTVMKPDDSPFDSSTTVVRLADDGMYIHSLSFFSC